MSETYVIDTSVLLSAGRKAFYSYPGAEIVIPLACVRELESKRSDPSLGYEARMVLRELDELREIGDLKTGVYIENNTKIRVEINHVEDVPEILKSYPTNDTRVITVASNLAKDAETSGDKVVLVSKNIPLKIIASLVNLVTEDFVDADVTGDFIDKTETFEISPDEMATLYSKGSVKLDLDVPLNVGVILLSGTSSALAISKTQFEFKLIKEKILSKNVHGKSAEQRVAIEQLTDEQVRCVSLGGVPGGGKSMLALAAGVEQLGKYKKIIIFRSMHAVGGEELGFLPGTEAEKMDPWTAAVFDSLESFLTKGQIDMMKTKQQLQVLPLTHIRGRTLNDAFIIVDEAQNLEKSVILTVLSRLGHGSKAVLTWDIAQRDNLHVGRFDGVYSVVSRMLGHKLFAHTSMRQSERSEFAQAVSQMLDDYK